MEEAAGLSCSVHRNCNRRGSVPQAKVFRPQHLFHRCEVKKWSRHLFVFTKLMLLPALPYNGP